MHVSCCTFVLLRPKEQLCCKIDVSASRLERNPSLDSCLPLLFCYWHSFWEFCSTWDSQKWCMRYLVTCAKAIVNGWMPETVTLCGWCNMHQPHNVPETCAFAKFDADSGFSGLEWDPSSGMQALASWVLGVAINVKHKQRPWQISLSSSNPYSEWCDFANWSGTPTSKGPFLYWAIGGAWGSCSKNTLTNAEWISCLGSSGPTKPRGHSPKFRVHCFWSRFFFCLSATTPEHSTPPPPEMLWCLVFGQKLNFGVKVSVQGSGGCGCVGLLL